MKKASVLLLTVFLIAALAFGCAGKAPAATSAPPAETKATEESTAPEESAEAPTTELATDAVEWSCMIPEFVNAPTTDDQLVWQGFKEKFNVQMRMEVVNSADFTTKMNLAVASDTPPNMIVTGTTALTKYYNSGVLVDLSSAMQAYAPDYLAEIGKDPIVVKNCKDDEGRMFFFSRLYWDYEFLYLSMNIGQLTDLGGKMPTTTDEFAAALQTMHQANPDEYFARGQWNAGAQSLQKPIYLAYGTSNSWVHFKEGEYVFGPYERKDQMKEALKFLNKMYTDGLIDPEFLTTDQDTYMAKFAAGQVAAVYGWLGGAHMWPSDANGRPLPDDQYDWKVVPALKGPAGEQWSERMNLVDEGIYFTKTMPDVNRGCNMLNYMYTPEGIEFMNWGIEGTTYTKDAQGNKALMEDVLKDPLGAMNGMRARGFYPAIFVFDADYDFYKYLVPQTMINGIEGNRPYRLATAPVLTGTDEENNKLAQLGTDIFGVIDEKLPKFVTGELSIDADYDAYIAQLESMGIQDYIDTIKAQYTRWQSR